MAKILLFEPEARYRVMLRFILEGINHRVLDAASGEDIPILLAVDKPDLIVLGVHLGQDPGMLTWQEWRLALPEVPTLILFSGDLEMRADFLEAWDGARPMNMMVQPVDPYPLLSMVKAMLTAPVEWRRGGQHSLSAFKIGAMSSLALLTVACMNPEESGPPSRMQPSVEKFAPLPLDPTPVAKITLANGNTLEFHDFESDLLILETGKAGITPFLDGIRSPEALEKLNLNPAERLSGIWKLAAPGIQMPQILTDIQARLKNQPDMSMSRERPAPLSEILGGPMTAPSGQPLSKAAAPDGCNNGCCDYQWLATLNDCRKYWEFNWFNYNWTWSKVTSTSIDAWSGTVCAATGSSLFKVNISDGHGGSWTVLQAHYRSFTWYKGTWDKNATSTVNSSASPALHTFCGNVSY